MNAIIFTLGSILISAKIIIVATLIRIITVHKLAKIIATLTVLGSLHKLVDIFKKESLQASNE